MTRDAEFWISAAQHEFNFWINAIGVMRDVGIVHGHNVGPHRKPVKAVVIGRDGHALRAFDHHGRVADEGDARMVLGNGRGVQRSQLNKGRLDQPQGANATFCSVMRLSQGNV